MVVPRQAGETVAELVLQFDVQFDVPMKHGACLGQLEIEGAFDRDVDVPAALDAASAHRLAEYVGASWCRIVRDDVKYHIVHGLETVEESRPWAEHLAAYVLKPAPSAPSEFCVYAAARWFDGAGKIHFRLGDLTNARLCFEKAVTIATHDPRLVRCLPDLRSNLVRAKFDENDMVGKAASLADLRSEYDGVLADLLKDDGLDIEQVDGIVAEPLKDLMRTVEARAAEIRSSDSRTSATSPFAISVSIPTRIGEDPERWRGYCSIFHNLSIAYKSKQGPLNERSEKESRRAAAIAWALSDRYRLAQALNHQAELHERADDNRAEFLSQTVLMLGWQRAARIAQQRLARIDGRTGKLRAAVSRIESIFAQIDLERKRRGGDLGVDVMSHKFTVDALASVLEAKHPDESEELSKSALILLRQQEDATVRSVRRVVKVSTYKAAYAKLAYPYFLGRIQSHILAGTDGEHEWMESFSFVEESSSRELLDVLREASRPKAFGKHSAEDPVPVPEDYKVSPGRVAIMGIRRLAPNDEDRITGAFREQRDNFEKIALAAPIESVPHNEEIGFDLRRFTAAHPGVCIIRYFFFGTRRDESGKVVAASLGAYVFRHGRKPAFVKLDLSTAKDVIADMEAHAADERERDTDFTLGLPCPSVTEARRLWNTFLAPLWQHVAAPDSMKLGGRVKDKDVTLPSHLVLVPAGELFRLPLHVAVPPSKGGEPGVPLCALLPISFSTSATTFVSRGRYLLTEQPIDDTDDLCFLAPLASNLYPAEMEGLSWPKDHFHVAGRVPRNLDVRKYWGKGDREGLARLVAKEPEIFVFSGHGLLHGDGDLGLQLEDGVLSHYEIPSRMRLPRNKLTLLAACVTGQGANLDGGEVSGFLRAFMAAGAGVLGVSLWSVRDDRMACAIRSLLKAASPVHRAPSDQTEQEELGQTKTFNAVTALHAYYKETLGGRDVQEQLEACPLVLYL